MTYQEGKCVAPNSCPISQLIEIRERKFRDSTKFLSVRINLFIHILLRMILRDEVVLKHGSVILTI